MKSQASTIIKRCMALSIITQARGGALVSQVAYADNIFLNLSKLDSIADNTPISPYQTNTSGLSFRIESPDENLIYNGLTIYAANLGGTSCSSTGDIESIITQVGLYQSGALLGNDNTVVSTGIDSCIYEIPFTTTLASGFHDFDIVFDTTGAAFNPEGSTLSFIVDNTSFPGLQTDNGTGVVPGDITGLADSADFLTQNPGLSDISNISTGASQVSYNNGYLTGFAVSLTSKSVSDVILSGFTVGQIGTNKFGSGGYDLPHTITLLDTTGSVLATTTINQTGDIIFQNLNYLIPAGQTYDLHMMVSYTGDVVANDFQFEGSYWNIYDTSGRAYPYLTSVPGLSIDINENTVTAINNINPAGGLMVNNLSGIYVGQMRFSSTTASTIEQIALINIKDPFYGTEVDSGALACSTSSSCDNISTGGDGLTVYITHSGQIVSSGIIISGAVILPLSTTVSIYDQGDLIDIYVLDSDGIQQSDQTNKVVMLGLLNTQNVLDLGGQNIETIVAANSNGNDLVANFNNGTIMVYNQYRIRNSLLSTSVASSLSGYKEINDIMYQTGVSLLGIELQSTGSTSYLYELVFNHNTNIQTDNFGLTIDGDANPNNAQCNLNSGLITCTMTGSYSDGFLVDSSIHNIILTADITGGIAGTGESITTSLISSTPSDYEMYDVASIPVQHSIIHSDGSDPGLTKSSVNWFTDAGTTLSNINLQYNIGGSEPQTNSIIITGILYQHTGASYSFIWDSYNTGFVEIFVQNITTSGSYIQQGQVLASSGIISPVMIGSTASYNIKLTPVTNTGASLGPDQIITLQHTGSIAAIFLYGNSNPFIELGGFFSDAGAYWDDGITQGFDNIIVTGTVNTNQLGVYPITYDYSDSFDNAALQVIRTVTVQDTTAPIIVISGGDTIDTEYGSGYTDMGATATDNSTGATIDLIGSGTVDTMILGDYYIYYEHTDPSGNTGYATRTVTVQDTTPPTLQFIGEETVTIGYNSSFSDSGAIWSDARDGTGIVYTLDTVPNIIGTHLVVYSHQDQAGNIGTITGAVIVVDNTIPIIIRNGSEFVTIEAGDSYTDSGATYNDDIAGVGPITASGTVNTLVPNSYLLTYDYTDPSGNTGIQETRTVTVQDTTAPVISIIGSTEMIVSQGGIYSESGATWTDIVDGSGSTLVSGTVDTSISGTYYVEYYYVDSAGNTNSAMRTVTVQDTTAPVISIIGSTEMIVSQGGIYSESGAAYSDNIDGTGIALISGTVNTNIIGTYVIEYYQVDSAGNTGTAIRTVEVVDLDAPSVTAIGSTGTIIEAGSSYTDSGANWSDMVDGTGSIFVGAWGSTGSFASSGTVNTSQPRIYYIQYQKVDSAGNSDIKTRTVTVQDTTAPVISIIGSTEMIVSQGGIYSESGATWTDIVDGTGSALISGTVNTNIPGTYILYYSKTDNAGNNSVETRTISVIDTDVYLSPVGYMQNIVNPNSYTITWTLGSGINKVEISMVDANIGGAYTNVSTILGTIGSGEINLYTGSTYLIKLTPVDDLSTPTGPDQIITIIHTISGSVSTGSVQPIKRTGGGGGSSGRPPIVVTQSGSTTSTGDTTPGSQIIPTKKQEATTGSDEVVSIKIGKDGRIIVIRPWDKKPGTDGRVFAKDLDKMGTTSSESISDAGDESGKPLILKKYWIITPEMIENPTILEEYEPTWDSTPRVSNKKLDPRLQSTSRDQDSTQEISNSFYRKMIIELKTIFYSQT